MTDTIDLVYSHLPHRKTIEFYCGDAAGRKGDFAISDRFLAENAGIPFLTPEEFFLEQKPQPIVSKKNQYATFQIPPYKTYQSALELILEKVGNADDGPPLLVMMVGPQGSGKSALTTALTKDLSSTTGRSLKVISQDTLKTKAKVQSAFTDALSVSCPVIIIDNTNSNTEKRESFLEGAKKKGYNTLIVYFDLEKPHCFHLNHVRVQVEHTDIKVPPVAIHTYYKNLEPPTEEEADKLITFDTLMLPESLNTVEFQKYYKYKYQLK